MLNTIQVSFPRPTEALWIINTDCDMSAFSVMILCLSSSKFKNLKDVYDFFSDSYYHIRFYFRGGIYFVDFDFSNFHVHILADGHVREPNQKF